MHTLKNSKHEENRTTYIRTVCWHRTIFVLRLWIYFGSLHQPCEDEDSAKGLSVASRMQLRKFVSLVDLSGAERAEIASMEIKHKVLVHPQKKMFLI